MGIEASAAWDDNRDARSDRWYDFRNRSQPGALHRGVYAPLDSDIHDYVHDETVPIADRARVLLDNAHPYGDWGLGMHWTPHVHIAERSIANAGSGQSEPWEDEDDWSEGESGKGTHADVIFHIRQPAQRSVVRDPKLLEQRSVGWQYSRDEDETPIKPGAPVFVTGVSWRPHDPEHFNEPFEHYDFPKPVRHTAAVVSTEGFPNTYHGNPEFGGNPDFSHTWFHGTKGTPRFGVRDVHDDAERVKLPPDQRVRGSSWPQPNQMMGVHFAPLHEVAHKFAWGSKPSAIVHAKLNFDNPAHYPTEKHLDYAVADWASKNFPEWHDEKLNRDRAWNYSDQEGTHADFSQVPEGYGNKAQDVLQWHPYLPEIIKGFHQHLRDQGHYGITYGNMVEGPYISDIITGGRRRPEGEPYPQANWPLKTPKSISAIAQPEDIQITGMEHIAPWDQEPAPGQVTWEQASKLDEPEEMRDRVLDFHRQNGGAYPQRSMHHEASSWEHVAAIPADDDKDRWDYDFERLTDGLEPERTQPGEHWTWEDAARAKENAQGTEHEDAANKIYDAFGENDRRARIAEQWGRNNPGRVALFESNGFKFSPESGRVSFKKTDNNGWEHEIHPDAYEAYHGTGMEDGVGWKVGVQPPGEFGGLDFSKGYLSETPGQRRSVVARTGYGPDDDELALQLHGHNLEHSDFVNNGWRPTSNREYTKTDPDGTIHNAGPISRMEPVRGYSPIWHDTGRWHSRTTTFANPGDRVGKTTGQEHPNHLDAILTHNNPGGLPHEAAAKKPKPKKPRKPEEVWYDVHKHPEGTPGGMGKSPEHHLRNRGWQPREIHGAGSKTIQYMNHQFPDFVISYGGASSTKPDHNFRVLYIGSNRNVPKVTRSYSVAEAMNKVQELHQLQSGLVVQPMTHGASSYDNTIDRGPNDPEAEMPQVHKDWLRARGWTPRTEPVEGETFAPHFTKITPSGIRHSLYWDGQKAWFHNKPVYQLESSVPDNQNSWRSVVPPGADPVFESHDLNEIVARAKDNERAWMTGERDKSRNPGLLRYMRPEDDEYDRRFWEEPVAEGPAPSAGSKPFQEPKEKLHPNWRTQQVSPEGRSGLGKLNATGVPHTVNNPPTIKDPRQFLAPNQPKKPPITAPTFPIGPKPVKEFTEQPEAQETEVQENKPQLNQIPETPAPTQKSQFKWHSSVADSWEDHGSDPVFENVVDPAHTGGYVY